MRGIFLPTADAVVAVNKYVCEQGVTLTTEMTLAKLKAQLVQLFIQVHIHSPNVDLQK